MTVNDVINERAMRENTSFDIDRNRFEREKKENNDDRK
nr:MAG TPA: hypothetical protein [Caudoviricetes sp.]